MFTRLMVLLAALSLNGCMQHPKPSADLGTMNHTQIRALKPFEQVGIRGRLNATLHSGFRHSQLVLKGHPEDLAHVITRIDGSRLILTLDSGYPKMGAVTADIQTQHLNFVDYQGDGRLSAPALNSPSLTLSINNKGVTSLDGQIGLRQLKVSGPGKVFINGIQSPYLALNLSKKARVQLAGVINTSQVTLTGHAWLSMHWVKSRYLTLRVQDDAFLQLAGAVDTLDACLSENAQFNGRYLRAERGFVKTSGQSIAKINAVKRQHTFATGRSDIYYYNEATMQSDFMASSGAVLDMRDWVP